MSTEALQHPNTTQIPHIIIREWMPRLKDVELRVLLVVADQTLGWIEDLESGRRKERDWISHYQLRQKTGRSDRAITIAVKNLVDIHGIIEALDAEGKKLDSAKKRQMDGYKIFYRLALKRPQTTLFDTPAKSAEGVDNKGITCQPPQKVRTQKVRTTKETPLQKYIYPSWLNLEAWGEWEQYRKEIKKPLTPTSIKLQLKMLEKYQREHAEIIRTSIRNRWTGIFPPKPPLPRGPYMNDHDRAAAKRREYEQEEREAAAERGDQERARELRTQAAGLAKKFGV